MEPEKFLINSNNEYLFKNIVKWQEIPRDDIKFFQFLKEVVGLLSEDKLPEAGHSCSHCRYIEDNRQFNHTDNKKQQNQDIVLN